MRVFLDNTVTERGRSLVFDNQNRMCEAFVHLLQKNRPEAKISVVFGRCLSVLRLCRHMTKEHQEMEERIILDWEDKLQFPPIFYELMTY